MAWNQLAKVTDFSLGDVPDSISDEPLLRATLAMKTREYAAACKILTAAIHAAPLNLTERFMMYDLRAACLLHTQQAEQALDDAMLCTKLNPEWARGWARLGAAQLCLGHYRASVSAYQRAVELEGCASCSEVQLGLQLARDALAGQGARRAAVHEQES